MKELIDLKLLKFLLVGVINTLIGAGIMFILYNCFGCNYWISSAANYVVGGIVSFLLNKFFTFKNQEKDLRQVIYFVLLLVICYLAAYIGAKKLVYIILSNLENIKLKDNIAMLTGMCVYTVLNYLGQRLFVFRSNKENEQA